MDLAHQYGIYGLGFFAQGLFGARLIVQLVISEKKGKIASPTVFWQLSVAASFLFLVYGILRNDLVIIIGQTLSFFIYIRNLQLKNSWKTFPSTVRAIIVCLPFAAIAIALFSGSTGFTTLTAHNNFLDPIIAMGAVGQLMLNLRFVYQWIYSEKQHESILPLPFWVISTVASVMIIVYAAYRTDPVLLVAQGLGIFVYVRNMFIGKTQSQKA